LLLSATLFWLTLAFAGQSPSARPTQAFINKRVAEIMDKALQTGTSTTPDGVRVTPMRADASMEDMDEVKSFGIRAVAPLSEYLDSSNYRAQHLAVRMLGYIGEKEVIAPLSKAAVHSRSEIVRLSAVDCLGQQSWSEVAAVVKRVAASDPNLLVREEAQRVIDAHENDAK